VRAEGPPEGTIALLFTDVQGSTRLARELGGAWHAVLADHDRLLEGAIVAEDGFIVTREGDAFFATFADASAAARAAVAAMRAFRQHAWPAGAELRVRMGLHVGYVERTSAGYVGLEVHRAARVAAAAHGGQLLLTAAARELVGDAVVLEPLGFHRLKDFPEAVQLFCAVVDGRGASAFPPPQTEEVRPTNLPAGTPILVGRDDEVERVEDALTHERDRIVTLTGRGGAGKTSLALVVAARSLEEFPGGVWLVRLANVAKADELEAAIAVAIGAVIDVGSSPHEAIVNRLRARGPALLVLDNMEHLTGAAGTVANLIEALPELRILVTSQIPLRLADEVCVALDALDDEAALALIERVARRRDAGFSAAGTDHEALLEVAHLLDGLPLALELAAARLAVLSPPQLVNRLRDSPDVLRDDRADRPERHRSLRATVDWTLSLLEPGARALFLRMGAFAGPVELEDLEAVAGGDGLDVLNELARLLDVALVRRVEAGDGRVRFGLPEALRQIAAELLDASPEGVRWRRAHAERAYELVWPARLVGCASSTAYRAAVAADAEIAAAIRWARATGDPLAEPLAAARAGMLADNGHPREALALLEPLLADPPADPAVRAQALWAHSWALITVSRLDEAIAEAEKVLEIAPSAEYRVIGLIMRALALTFRGEHAPAMRDNAQATALARELDPAVLYFTLSMEAQARLFGGDLDRARELHAAAAAIGEAADAEFLWRRHTSYGDYAALSGRPHEALGHYANSLEEAQIRGNELQVLFDLFGVASALGAVGADEDAIEVAALADQQIAELGIPGATAVHLMGQDQHLGVRKRLDAATLEASEARARAVPAGQRVTRACQLARARVLMTSGVAGA
jgi:predicted ATPase/class 3 adenylate cyclase